jgi:uncharacterized protein involved in copper resistance
MVSILLLAFGLNALAPAGYMISATDGGLPTISVCPETHPLARAVAAAGERHETHEDTAMDHAAMGHAAMDHAEMGHVVVDHAAMGHTDDDGTAPVTASDGHCALASAAKVALHSADEALLVAEMVYAVLLGLKAIRPLALRPPPHLRPPLRGPPPAI